MRTRPETLLITVMLAFALTGVAATFLDDLRLGAHDPVTAGPDGDARVDQADAWFAAARPFCNPVEVETRLRRVRPPATERGTMHEAACYALAGKIDEARATIETLPEGSRYEAAGVVFSAGHPAADAGDNLAAGPLMELVLEFWPSHYMALYHAGTAAWERGDHDKAERYLTAFLDEYATEDAWRANARSMLARMEG